MHGTSYCIPRQQSFYYSYSPLIIACIDRFFCPALRPKDSDVTQSVKVYLYVQSLGNYWPDCHEICCGYSRWMMIHSQKT